MSTISSHGDDVFWDAVSGVSCRCNARPGCCSCRRGLDVRIECGGCLTSGGGTIVIGTATTAEPLSFSHVAPRRGRRRHIVKANPKLYSNGSEADAVIEQRPFELKFRLMRGMRMKRDKNGIFKRNLDRRKDMNEWTIAVYLLSVTPHRCV